MNKTVAVDVDGPLFSYSGWKGIDYYGEPVRGARRALRWLRSKGFKIVIYTCRTNPDLVYQEKGFFSAAEKDILLEKVIGALSRARVPYDEIAVNGKPYADFYIDDHAVRFKDWGASLRFISKQVTGKHHGRARERRLSPSPPTRGFDYERFWEGLEAWKRRNFKGK